MGNHIRSDQIIFWNCTLVKPLISYEIRKQWHFRRTPKYHVVRRTINKLYVY